MKNNSNLCLELDDLRVNNSKPPPPFVHTNMVSFLKKIKKDSYKTLNTIPSCLQ